MFIKFLFMFLRWSNEIIEFSVFEKIDLLYKIIHISFNFQCQFVVKYLKSEA